MAPPIRFALFLNVSALSVHILWGLGWSHRDLWDCNVKVRPGQWRLALLHVNKQRNRSFWIKYGCVESQRGQEAKLLRSHVFQGARKRGMGSPSRYNIVDKTVKDPDTNGQKSANQLPSVENDRFWLVAVTVSTMVLSTTRQNFNKYPHPTAKWNIMAGGSLQLLSATQYCALKNASTSAHGRGVGGIGLHFQRLYVETKWTEIRS